MLTLKDIDAGYSRDPMADWIVWTNAQGSFIEYAFGPGGDKATAKARNVVTAKLYNSGSPDDYAALSVLVDDEITTVLAAKPGTESAWVLAHYAI